MIHYDGYGHLCIDHGDDFTCLYCDIYIPLKYKIKEVVSKIITLATL